MIVRVDSLVFLFFVISGGAKAGPLECYVSPEYPVEKVGFKTATPMIQCNEKKGVKIGDKIDMTTEVEHKHAYPTLFVKANVNDSYKVIEGIPNGLNLVGPLLYPQYFSSSDDLVCFKMQWNCTKVDNRTVEIPFIVSKYGVALKGQKEKMCPKEVEAFNSCKVYECGKDLCNGGILPCIGIIAILAQVHLNYLFLT